MKKFYFPWHNPDINCPYKLERSNGEIIVATSTLCKKCEYYKDMIVDHGVGVTVFCKYEESQMNRNGANK